MDALTKLSGLHPKRSAKVDVSAAAAPFFQWSDDVGFRNLRKGLGQLDDLFAVNPIVVGDEYTLS